MLLSVVRDLAPDQEASSYSQAIEQTIEKAQWSEARLLTSAILLGFAIRFIVVLCVFRVVSAPTFDHNEFGWEMGWTARSLALGHGFASPFLPQTGPTALVPPLYPYLLAGIFKLFGLYSGRAACVTLLLNSVFSALTTIPIYYSAKWALQARTARIIAFAWALYPFAIYFSANRVWDYALTALLFSFIVWAAQKLHLRGPLAWLGFGILCGITFLSNPSVLVVTAVLVLLAMYKVSRVSGPWLTRGLICMLGVLLTCAPWCIRNQHVMHHNILIRDGFWLEFWAGNHGDTSNSNPAAAHPASNAAEMQTYEQSGELDYMAQKKAMALEYVEHHPAFFVSLTARRIVRFWTGFWSFRKDYLADEPMDVPNLFFCGGVTLLVLRGMRRWWKEDRSSALPYIMAVALFPIPYYLTHSSMDYRQPLEPILVLLLALGLFGVRGRRRSLPDTPVQVEETEAVLA